MARASRCALCDEQLRPVLAEREHWRLILNRNQDLLGKCFLVLRSHRESITELTGEEWADLLQQSRLATRALHETLHPDHVNYAFLQNQDRHVHLHIIPRYATPRAFAGEQFSDPAFGDHYAVGGPGRPLPSESVSLLAKSLREAISRTDSVGRG